MASDSEGSKNSSQADSSATEAEIDDDQDENHVPGALPWAPTLKFIFIFTALGCIGHLLNIIFKDYRRFYITKNFDKKFQKSYIFCSWFRQFSSSESFKQQVLTPAKLCKTDCTWAKCPKKKKLNRN